MARHRGSRRKIKTNKYWISVRGDPSAEYEHTLTSSPRKAKKFLREFSKNKSDKRKYFIEKEES